jgi:hypothetical protein
MGFIALIDKFYHRGHREHRDGNTNAKLQKPLRIKEAGHFRWIENPAEVAEAFNTYATQLKE